MASEEGVQRNNHLITFLISTSERNMGTAAGIAAHSRICSFPENSGIISHDVGMYLLN